MKESYNDNALKCRLLKSLAAFSLAFLILYTLKAVCGALLPGWDSVIVGIFSAVSLIGLSLSVAYPIFAAKAFSFSVTNEYLEINKGVFRKAKEAVPIEAVVRIELSADPIDRLFCCCTLKAHTASTSHRIPYLDKEGAKVLAAEIMRRKNEIP